MLEVGNSIPPELYEVIAAVYCQLLKTSSEIKNSGVNKDDPKERLNLIRNNRRETRSNKKDD
jgi:hypothetical protein